MSISSTKKHDAIISDERKTEDATIIKNQKGSLESILKKKNLQDDKTVFAPKRSSIISVTFNPLPEIERTASILSSSSIELTGKRFSAARVMRQPQKTNKKGCDVIPWVPTESSKTRYQMRAAFTDNLLDHMYSLNPDSETSPYPVTKIISCVGPDSSNEKNIEKLLDAGMTTVLLPMWVFTKEEKLKAIQNIRNALQNVKNRDGCVYPLGIGIDLRGLQVCTGRLHVNPVHIKVGTTLRMTVDPVWRGCGTATKVFIDFPVPMVPHKIPVGVKIIIDSGMIAGEVVDVTDEELVCYISKGGKLFNNRIVHLLNVPLMGGEVPDHDLEDIQLAVNSQIDFLFVPAVFTESVILEIKKILAYCNADLLVVSKIEHRAATHNVDKIVAASDAVVISRQSLEVEVLSERITLIQDMFISACKMLGKPVYMEGLLLRERVMSNLQFKSDDLLNTFEVMNSCQRGIDGFIMRYTLHFGLDYQKIFQTTIKICSVAEPSYWHSHFFSKMSSEPSPPVHPLHALSIAAVHTAMIAGAVAIILITESGETAKLICRYSPRVPVLAITRFPRVARLLTVFRAAVPYVYTDPPVSSYVRDVDLMLQAGIRLGKEIGIIQSGDPIILVNGSRAGPNVANTMRMVYASSADTSLNRLSWTPSPPKLSSLTDMVTDVDDSLIQGSGGGSLSAR